MSFKRTLNDAALGWEYELSTFGGLVFGYDDMGYPKKVLKSEPNEMGLKLLAAYSLLVDLPISWAKHQYCLLTDHQWVDDSYGGPDSGCMAAHCSRCGESFHHTLY